MKLHAALIFLTVALICAAPAFAGTPGDGAATIKGDYAEFRTADVYTGPCFANGEVGLTGEEAVLAWHVTSGTWKACAWTG